MSVESLRSATNVADTLYYFNSNKSFGGTGIAPIPPFASSGHKVVITATKNTDICCVKINMSRTDGIHFNILTPGVGNMVLATLPAGYRPTTTVSAYSLGYNGTTMQQPTYIFGGFQIGTDGKIYQTGPADNPQQSVDPLVTCLDCTIYFSITGATSYVADGIV